MSVLGKGYHIYVMLRKCKSQKEKKKQRKSYEKMGYWLLLILQVSQIFWTMEKYKCKYFSNKLLVTEQISNFLPSMRY